MLNSKEKETEQLHLSTSEQKESFKNLINDLKEVRPETAKIVADFKSAGDDTLSKVLS